jgi:hypothetical protein
MHDASGHADENGHADPYADRDPRSARGLGREQDERRMVARRRAGRSSRRDRDDRLPVRREHDAPRLQLQPVRGSSASPNDYGLAAAVENEARRARIDHRGRIARVRDRDRAARRTRQLQPHGRDGDRRRSCRDHVPITVKVSVDV